MAKLGLRLRSLEPANPGGHTDYHGLSEVRNGPWEWDKVVRGAHLINCFGNRSCLFNIYLKDGMVLREEQVGVYPPRNDPAVPDFNPRGCQKGVCTVGQINYPGRLKYPLKRAGARGEGKWQRVSWEEALSEIADHVVEVLRHEGNDVIMEMNGTFTGGSEGMGLVTLFTALGIPRSNTNLDDADERPGRSITLGKSQTGCSADAWFYPDILAIWGCNPAYTQIANFHFIPEARYNGTRVVVISPDHNASAPFADLWVPINVGSDAALALSMAQVIISQGLHNSDFVREQTDLSLLVRTDNRKFLVQKDLQRGGREDVFYMFDEASRKVVEAPRRSLALNGLVPALQGDYEVNILRGSVRVRPVFEVLKEHLQDYTPEKAAPITGVSPQLIRRFAVEFATAKGVTNVMSTQWGKHYHGDLLERALLLLWALCGYFGRKEANSIGGGVLNPDTKFGATYRRGVDLLLSAAASDPRFPVWQAEGFTDEMILQEYAADAYAQGTATNLSMLYYFHSGLRELEESGTIWDPEVKRPLAEYIKEALDKGWQVMVPGPEKAPKIVLANGGSFLRRSRNTAMLLKSFLPKVRLLVALDYRMGSTALYSDFVLPTATSYEKYSVSSSGFEIPYFHLQPKVVEPPGEAKGEWEIACLLARKIEETARAKGISGFTDFQGKERRLDNLYDRVTVQGIYSEDDDESITRDYYLSCTNVQQMEWDEYKEAGVVPFTRMGQGEIGAGCDLVPGEPIVPFVSQVHKKQPYPTYTRRMQFYIDHDWFLDFGEELPTHKEIPPMGGQYPLKLTSGHARWSIHSVWTDDPMLLRLQRGEPIMFMSAVDAAARGIADGDRVEVFNDVGRVETQAAVSPAVRPGQIIIYHGWENLQFRGKRHFKGLMPSPIKPIELVGGYYQIRPRTFSYGAQPGGCDRGSRCEVRKAEKV